MGLQNFKQGLDFEVLHSKHVINTVENFLNSRLVILVLLLVLDGDLTISYTIVLKAEFTVSYSQFEHRKANY